MGPERWERLGGDAAWLAPWGVAFERAAGAAGAAAGIVAELRTLADPAARMSAGLLVDEVEDAPAARAALAAVFDAPSVTRLTVFTTGDGAAMSGLAVAGHAVACRSGRGAHPADGLSIDSRACVPGVPVVILGMTLTTETWATAELAYEAAFARHWIDVFRFAIAWTNDWSAAEDLTQEAFLRLWRASGHDRLVSADRAVVDHHHAAPGHRSIPIAQATDPPPAPSAGQPRTRASASDGWTWRPPWAASPRSNGRRSC